MKTGMNHQDAEDTRKRRNGFTSNLLFKHLCLFLALLASWRFSYAVESPRALPPNTEAKIRALLQAPEVQAAHVGVMISALGSVDKADAWPSRLYDDKTQPVLFAQDADKRFMPASNMKLFTSAMALKVLGPEKRFVTRLFHRPPVKGATAGVFQLLGGGDPSLKAQDFESLAQSVKQANIKSFALVTADGSLFRSESFGGRYPDGWTLDDTLWYYGPEVSALAYERNQIDVSITGGSVPGAPATITSAPPSPRFFDASGVTTGTAVLAGRSEDDLLRVQNVVTRKQSDSSVAISGAVAPNQKLTLGLAVPHVDDWAAFAFDDILQKAGVKKTDGLPRMKGLPGKPEYGPAQEIAQHESPPVRELLKRLLKNSDNLYAEMMLRNAAVESVKPQERKANFNYATRGHELIKSWLGENGVDTLALRFSDGSGLSRYNLVTPRAVAGVLSSAEKLNGGEAFWNAMPIAGVDGTLRNRMKGTSAENNARAKTGTFSIVSCLSGYVTTRDGHRLSVVVLTNFVPNGQAARRFQDQIFATLAEADF